MRKTSRSTVLVLGTGLLCVGIAGAEETRIYGALTSDYVYRGISLSDEGAALQIGIDLSTEFGLFGGVWASTADISTGSRDRSREVDYYIGYIRYFDNDWSASISLNRYAYPGATGAINYGYNEIIGIVGFDDRIWLEIDFTNSLFGHDVAAHNVEILANWPLSANYRLTTGVGYFDVSEFAGSGYTHWQIGLSRPVAWATFDIRYHDTDSVPARISRSELADPRVVLAISAAF